MGPRFSAGAGVIAGGLRALDGRVAPAPYPASAFVAAARFEGERWRFAAADGTLYESQGLLGALRRVGALPRALVAPTPRDGASTTQRFGRGALVAVDVSGVAWIDRGDGAAPSALALVDVAHALAADARTVLAVVTPGALRVSRDGARSFHPEALPRGAARSVGFDEVGPFARGTDGDARWRDGAWVAEPVAQPAVPGAPPPRALLPSQRDRITWCDERIAIAEGDRISFSRSDIHHTEGSITAPGGDCALSCGAETLYARCRHGGWALALHRYDARRRAWETLRDEARAQPIGALFVDPLRGGYVVHAPCAQRTVADPRRVCVVDRAGVATEHALPFTPSLRGMLDGAAFAVDASAPATGPARVARITSAGVTLASAPCGEVTLHGELIALDRSSDGTISSLQRAPFTAPPWQWRRVALPPGVRAVLHRGAGELITAGDDARALARFDAQGARAPLPSPVNGDPRLLAPGAEGARYCAGPWCRVGDGLVLGPAVIERSSALTREALPAPTPPRSAPRPASIRCVDEGAATPSEELDHGAAVGGYAIRSAREGDRVRVEWFGPRLRGAVTASWPGAQGAIGFTLGAVSAARPVALSGRCSAGVCAHALFELTGRLPVELPDTAPGATAVYAHGEGWMVRSDAVREGSREVRVTVVPRGGGEAARGVFVFDATRAVDVGSLDGAPGTWARVSPTRLRFYDLDGVARGEVTEDRAGCASTELPRGVIRRGERAAEVAGEGWRVEEGEWIIEETLHVYGERACTAAIGGGEPREEPPESSRPRGERREVRTFMLRAAGPSAFQGTAWGGRRASPQRCAWSP